MNESPFLFKYILVVTRPASSIIDISLQSRLNKRQGPIQESNNTKYSTGSWWFDFCVFAYSCLNYTSNLMDIWIFNSVFLLTSIFNCFTPCVIASCVIKLTPPPNKMAAILHTIFRCIFATDIFFFFWLKFHWSLFLRVLFTITQHWFR